jgi:hypothetical protein
VADVAVELYGARAGVLRGTWRTFALLPDPAAVLKFGIDSAMADERKALFRSDDSLPLTGVPDFCLRSWLLPRKLAHPVTGAAYSSRSDPHPRGPSACGTLAL